MTVKFFGQYLIEQGEIDAGQLREALEHMRSRNRTLGELAIADGLLVPSAAASINAAQRVADRRFGELAVEQGLLTRDSVERLVRRQRETHLPLGEALVELGHLPATRLGALLDQFKCDQSPFVMGRRSLPPALAGERAVSEVLDLLPRCCMRVARLHVKIAPPRPYALDPELRHRVSVAVRGARCLTLGLAADADLARRLGHGIAGGDSAEDDPSLTVDALGEFLNVVAGGAVARLEADGVGAGIEPVRLGELPASGHVFDLVATTGRGALFVHSAAG